MLVIATGISGSLKKEHLNGIADFATPFGKRVKVVHTGERLKRQARGIGMNFPDDNILNVHPLILASLRAADLNMLIGEDRSALLTLQCQYDAVMVSLHARFLWNGLKERSFLSSYIEKLEPDLFVTFIDSTSDILRRLQQRPQWQGQYLNAEKILDWQNEEINATAEYAQSLGKPFYIIPVRQPFVTFFNLMFHHDIPRVYVSVPMTHVVEPEIAEKIGNFVTNMHRRFITFDPRTVDLAGPDDLGGSPSALIAEDTHTVYRDLRLVIPQCEITVAYIPKIISSPGRDSEKKEAYETGKHVWSIYPHDVASPFHRHYATRHFRSPEEFFNFVDNEFYEGKLPRLVYFPGGL